MRNRVLRFTDGMRRSEEYSSKIQKPADDIEYVASPENHGQL